MDDERLVSIVTCLLKTIRVPVTAASIRSELSSHPDGNSFAAISDVLNKWKVSSSAYRISPNQLNEIPCPFISQFSNERSDFLVVDEIGGGIVRFVDGHNHIQQVSIEQFSSFFSGVVLVCDADAASGEKDYKRKRIIAYLNAMRLPGIILLIVSLLSVAEFFYTKDFEIYNWRFACLTMTKLLGLVAGFILFEESSGKKTTVVQRFCQGESFSCRDVVSSKQARILWGTVTWADLGVLYFSSTLLMLLFGVQSRPILRVLSLLSMPCIVYSFFSIYYQAIVLRKWCLLCCIVQMIFWVETILLFPFFGISDKFIGIDFSICFVTLILPLTIWLFVKPLFLRAGESVDMSRALRSFLYNENLFNHALSLQPKFSLPDMDNSIILGAEESNTTISVVLSPYCEYCASLYRDIEGWLSSGSHAKLQIILKAPEGANGNKVDVVRHLVSLYRERPDIFPLALGEWYRTRNYVTWAKKYSLPDPRLEIEKIMDVQKRWCADENISVTPLLLVNGFQLPQPYGVETLRILFG